MQSRNKNKTQNNIDYFPHHRFFDISHAHFAQKNLHVDRMPIKERLHHSASDISYNFFVFFALIMGFFELMSLYSDKKDSDREGQWLSTMGLALLATMSAFLNEVYQTRFRTAFYSQDTDPSDQQILTALSKAKTLIPDIYEKWKKTVLPNRLKKALGFCLSLSFP